MVVEAATLRVKLSPPTSFTAPQLRGAIASMFPDLTLLHNHSLPTADGMTAPLLYLYPRVQYRAEAGQGVLVGLEEGAALLTAIGPSLESAAIRLGRHTARVESVEVQHAEQPFGLATDATNPLCYRFDTPWLALNQSNWEHYRRTRDGARQGLLRRTLIGNVLSMAKSLAYHVPGDIVVSRLAVDCVSVTLKDTPMVGFQGTFAVNVHLPDGFGLGKSVSRGFGCVRRVESAAT